LEGGGWTRSPSEFRAGLEAATNVQWLMTRNSKKRVEGQFVREIKRTGKAPVKKKKRGGTRQPEVTSQTGGNTGNFS